MKRYAVVWRPGARADLLALYDWIAELADSDTAFDYTSGIEAQASEWVWFARGIDTDRQDERGDFVNNGTVETQQRAQHAAWVSLMCATG